MALKEALSQTDRLILSQERVKTAGVRSPGKNLKMPTKDGCFRQGVMFHTSSGVAPGGLGAGNKTRLGKNAAATNKAAASAEMSRPARHEAGL
jgi:hypothetical protein